jgi:hypothetical protein
VRQIKENKNSPSWTTTKRKTHRPKQKNQNKNLQFGLEPTPPARERTINPTASATLRTVGQVCLVAQVTDANVAVRSLALLGDEVLP